MDAFTAHIADWLVLYLAIVLLGLIILWVWAFDKRSIHQRGQTSEHERTVHRHDPFAGMDEHG
jgi:cbb3-type cytochrome oxidase subunit 3